MIKKIYNKLKIYSLDNNFIFFSIIAAVPLLIIPGSWDGVLIDYAFVSKDFSGILNWYDESGSHLQLPIYYFVYLINHFFLINHEILLDLVTILFLILFSYESKNFSQKVLRFDESTSNYTAILIITFPTWHTLVAFNLSLYLIFFYFCLFGYNLLSSKNYVYKIIGTFFIIYSFGIKSNFAFVIALCVADFLCLYVYNKKLVIAKIVYIFFISVISYLVMMKHFPPYGLYSSYNIINFTSINIKDLIYDISKYFTFLLYYLWIPLIYLFVLKIKNKKLFENQIEKLTFVKEIIIISLVSTILISPYLLVNKSTNLLELGGYIHRHAYLISFTFGLFFALLLKKNFYKSDRFNSIKKYLSILIIAQNILILSAGFYIKFETSLFKSNFINELKNYDNLPSASVKIIAQNIPGSIMPYEIAHLFYKSFNKAAWWGLITKKEELDTYYNPSELIISKKAYRSKYILKDYNLGCVINIEIENELNRSQRIFKLYIFNSSKYFNIKKMSKNC